jgi:predicted DNA-binding transcriptional regulator YafY
MDRLYALVEELRAVAPQGRSARQLAERFEVSKRTIERDISALQQAGVPISTQPGRRGGYVLDKAMSLPPLNFTPGEVAAVSVMLSTCFRSVGGDAKSLTAENSWCIRLFAAPTSSCPKFRQRSLVEA